MTTHRPWGKYTILLDAEYAKVKELVVEPGKRLSYQYHFKRDEHWTVVSGNAHVVFNGEVHSLSTGDTIHIPRETKHRLANDESQPLHVIEVQTGDYFGEDDIVRIEDDFGRN